MKKRVIDYAVAVFGVLLIGTGFILLKMTDDPQKIMRSLPYICIGFGCGIFGHGMGNTIGAGVRRQNPEFAKQERIDANDERNIAIGNRAKAKAFDMMIYVFGALMVSYALMGVDMIAILLLVGLYLFVVGYGIYYRGKYEKEM